VWIPFHFLVAVKSIIMKKKLKRKTFDEVIESAFQDYLNGGYADSLEFSGFRPGDAPNRNPKQIPLGLWLNLIYRHINKLNYN
jgi:hypothetical protein